MATRAADQSPAPPADGPARRRVFVHIGEPKTGTTFLQQVMWRNRAELAAQGVVLPGHHPQDHFRASQDLRGIENCRRPGRVLDRRVGHPGHQARRPADRGHLPRAFLGRRRPSRPSGRCARCSRRGPRRADRAGHGLAAARRVAGDRQAPQHRGWEDWLADVIDRESVDGPAPVLVLAGPRHAGPPGLWSRPRAAGAGARDHHAAARVRQRAAVGAVRRRCSASIPAGSTCPGPGRTPRSACRRSSSCGASTRPCPPRSRTGSTCGR